MSGASSSRCDRQTQTVEFYRRRQALCFAITFPAAFPSACPQVVHSGSSWRLELLTRASHAGLG